MHRNRLENQGKGIGHYREVVRIPRIGGLLNHYERVA